MVTSKTLVCVFSWLTNGESEQCWKAQQWLMGVNHQQFWALPMQTSPAGRGGAWLRQGDGCKLEGYTFSTNKNLCCGAILGNSSVTLPLSGAVLRTCVVLSYTSLLKAMISTQQMRNLRFNGVRLPSQRERGKKQ